MFIFISYSSKNKNVADALCHYLEEHNIPCWIAPSDILPGQTWAGAIVQAISNCSAMVLIYTAESNASHQVANEVDKAFSYGKTIIPFIVDATPMNDDLNYYLSRKHWLVAYPNYKENFKPLVDSLIRLIPDLQNHTSTQASQPASILEENTNIISGGTAQDNLPKDEDGRKLYQKACQGEAEAQFELGYNYFYGRGVEEDEEEAITWYRKAAEQGHADAQYELGDCYLFAWGVAEDHEEAAKWYRKAAEQGNAQAQKNLGDCYFYGRGVEEDEEEAITWYRKAAEQGFEQAKNILGRCYYFGWGVEEDHEEAVRWFRMAAEQEYDEAQYNLGNCYYDGLGVAQDYEEAERWYRLAAEQGHARAKEKLEKITKEQNECMP